MSPAPNARSRIAAGRITAAAAAPAAIALFPWIAYPSRSTSLPQPKQRAAVATGASFLPTCKTSMEAAGVPPLPLGVVDAFSKVEPDDRIRRAMPLRLSFIAKRSKGVCQGEGRAAHDHRQY